MVLLPSLLDLHLTLALSNAIRAEQRKSTVRTLFRPNPPCVLSPQTPPQHCTARSHLTKHRTHKYYPQRSGKEGKLYSQRAV